MGIKQFFSYVKNTFPDDIFRLKKGQIISDLKEESILETEIHIDHLLIDMNGLFHTSAQKIYEYGNFKPRQRLMGHRRPQHRKKRSELEVFAHVCATVDKLLEVVQPRRSLVMCVDGVAPIAKQCQQKQRRFMSARERAGEDSKDTPFDSCSITPGTRFMDRLNRYIDWYVRSRTSEQADTIWRHLDIVFSNEKAPGEGEHKLISYIRQYGNMDHSYCLHGMDADLVMLALGTHIPNFWILREDQMDPAYEFFLIDILSLRKHLIELMRWDTTDKADSKEFDEQTAINDFIFLCFTVGNDFLPHIPAIEIIEGSIDLMLEIYRDVGKDYGHLTKKYDERRTPRIRFHKVAVRAFLGTVATYEQKTLQDKLQHKDRFYRDSLLEKHSTLLEDNQYELDIKEYRKEYYTENFGSEVSVEDICREYLQGMYWVINYYIFGVPDWEWKYPYHYAPFAHDIARYMSKFTFTEFRKTGPTVPFIQLLGVLPPKSAYLLPTPLSELITDKNSPLADCYPEDFETDLSGKRQEWEAVVLLPPTEYSRVEKEYFKLIQKVNPGDRKRNKLGRTFLYRQTEFPYVVRSYYGDFTCYVSADLIDL